MQMKLPLVLAQAALGSHTSGLAEHSSMSVKYIIKPDMYDVKGAIHIIITICNVVLRARHQDC